MGTVTIPIRCTNIEQITEITEKLKSAAQKMEEVNATLAELTSSSINLKLEIEV